MTSRTRTLPWKALACAAALTALPPSSFGEPTQAVVAPPKEPRHKQDRQQDRPHHREHHRDDRFGRLDSGDRRPQPTVGSQTPPAAPSFYQPGVDPARLQAERGWGPRELAALGQDAYQHGDFAVASQAARLALAQSPHDPEAQAVLSLSSDRASSPQAEFASARDAVASAPSVAVKPFPAFAAAPASAATAAATRTPAQEQGQALAAQAAQALAIGDYTAAVQAASAALARDPADARAWNVRAVAQTKLGRYQDAVADATQALSLDARQPAVLLTRSWASSKMGRFDEAEKDARAALELDRSAQDSRALEALAFALAGQGKRGEALDRLRQAAASSPELQPLYAKASELSRAQDIAALFGDPSQAAPAAPRAREGRRWLKLAVPAVSLGLWMIVLGLLPRRDDDVKAASSAA